MELADKNDWHSLKIIGIESRICNGITEWYYDAPRQIFNCIKGNFTEVGVQAALRRAIKVISNTKGPEGLVPSPLIYGKAPTYPAINTVFSSQMNRIEACTLAKLKMAGIIAELQTKTAEVSRLHPA